MQIVTNFSLFFNSSLSPQLLLTLFPQRSYFVFKACNIRALQSGCEAVTVPYACKTHQPNCPITKGLRSTGPCTHRNHFLFFAMQIGLLCLWETGSSFSAKYYITDAVFREYVIQYLGNRSCQPDKIVPGCFRYLAHSL